MSITVSISNAALLAAVAVKAAEQDKDSATFLQDFLTGSCAVWRNDLALDRITSSAFVARFTVQEYADIRASSDPVLQGFVTRVAAEPYVWLGSDEVAQGMAYVVAQGLLSQARADEILVY